ncbi:MAG: helix-turn-helix transcriptional regulator [Candidatus Onthovivens sp.]|nr:helix-turn-helix transcriptional regulator [Candidatus Onthovivens sp.]
MLNSLNLKKIRCERELSISQLSYKCGIARGYLYELENNTYDNPSLKIICKLCRGLKISPNELINQELWK